MAQTLTGRSRFAQYLHSFQLKKSLYYACDHAKIRDMLHVLDECPMFLQDRVALKAEIGVIIRRWNSPEIMENGINLDEWISQSIQVLRGVISSSEYTTTERRCFEILDNKPTAMQKNNGTRNQLKRG
ncbi:hypothetical protein EVAR_34295_1 [Eumeta japonica]|uniref:Uncharacterized protein n=1 Tax=Eumeta variegata TaxID=151549 RepID=A0A4C1VYQ9_EUMVA|nr:hypothetical protein EVAR_34295_1 [Eumeta japonica]